MISLFGGIRVRFPSAGKDGASVTYGNVGNNLDCSAQAVAEGRFRFNCSFEQSSLYGASEGQPLRVDPAVPPLLRTFNSEAVLILRDGQTAQHTAATDPVSGDVLKVDVTLSVVR